MPRNSGFTTGLLIILVFLVLCAGCTGEKVSSGLPTTLPTRTPYPLPASAVNCTIPILKLNNTQAITNFSNEELRLSTPEKAGNVPFGAIVYHMQGFTRFFDNTGNQIMIVDDTNSTTMTPEGPASSTYGFLYNPSEVFIPKNESVTLIYLTYANSCTAIIINPPGVKSPHKLNMGP